MINKIKKYWEGFRISEVLLMSGFFIIGGLFAINEFDCDSLLKLFGLAILSFFIVLSIYSFNAAAGKTQDNINLRLKNLWNFSKRTFLKIFFVFFIISLVLSFVLNPYSAALCFIIILLWILYSHPRYGLKQKAVWGTLVHFFAQILHFIMAWIIFSELKIETVLIALFFSIAFSAGHILHEIIDYNSDKRSGFKTSPIVFGIKPTTRVLATILFVNIMLLTCLGFCDLIPFTAFIAFLPASVTHLLLILIIVYFNRTETKAIIIRYVYRVAYLLSGLSYLALLLFS
ncbi:MAG: UbiA family prenyltransferase [Bacteroidales bacterium]